MNYVRAELHDNPFDFANEIMFNSFRMHMHSEINGGLEKFIFSWITGEDTADVVCIHPGEVFIYNKEDKRDWRIEKIEG